MGRLIQIAASTLLSGGILNHGSLGGYISNATRLALGMGLAELQDGQVHYFSRHHDLLKRAAIQVASQTAYGLLRSYPRYLKYWEQQVRDKYLQTQSQSSLANKTGQYYQLIREQQAVAQKKNHIDSIVGRTVADFLELSISEEGKYYDNSECKVLPNSRYGLVTFVDLGPQVQVSSRNNILLTRVQGRDYTRKEYISGGDLEITINGKVDGDIFEADGVNADSTVIIEGTVNGGTIEADNVVVTGSVSVKKVVAHKALIVISNGKIFADEIFYGTITSDDSSVINGKLEKISPELAAEKAVK
jgi:cytoskeletal protein CcmA (bactofilin family)